jgi:predicted aspartyl protease
MEGGMRKIGAGKMGRVQVDVELANNDDVVQARNGHLDLDKVRRVRIQGVVDSGATRLVLFRSVAKTLGLASAGKVKVRYADGRLGVRNKVEGIYLELLGRHSIFNAIVESKRETALIGAIVMEDLDLLVDGAKQRLVPRDPDYVVSEIE